MKEQLHITHSVLIVESDLKHAYYIKAFLELTYHNIQIYMVETPDAALELIKHISFDIFIIEPQTRGTKYNGIELAIELLAKNRLIQIIFQSHITDLQYRMELHKKFTHSPTILKASLTYNQELKEHVGYSLDFSIMTASRKIIFDKKSNSYIFDIKEIEYIYKIPNEKEIAIHYLDQITQQFKTEFISNIGLTNVLDLLEVRQDLARVEDKHLINPLMIRRIDHRTGEIIMLSGARIKIGKTYRPTIGILLNALKK